jgi:hypothetical protein
MTAETAGANPAAFVSRMVCHDKQRLIGVDDMRHGGDEIRRSGVVWRFDAAGRVSAAVSENPLVLAASRPCPRRPRRDSRIGASGNDVH